MPALPTARSRFGVAAAAGLPGAMARAGQTGTAARRRAVCAWRAGNGAGDGIAITAACRAGRIGRPVIVLTGAAFNPVMTREHAELSGKTAARPALPIRAGRLRARHRPGKGAPA